jgi:hypothetical protein
LFFTNCTKNVEDAVVKDSISRSSQRTSEIANREIKDISYYSNLGSPVRDVISFLRAGGTLPPIQQRVSPGIDFRCCNGICLTIPTGDIWGKYLPLKDSWGNVIDYTGKYGGDARQMY